MNDIQKFKDFYSQFGIEVKERTTPNDKISTSVVQFIGTRYGVCEVSFDKDGKFIEINFFED